MRTRKFNSHYRFTLVELLVVLTIISILASLLLPALANAVASARSIDCCNRSRQLGMAMDLYCGDFKDHYPVLQSANGSWPQRLAWGGYLQVEVPYAIPYDPYGCPSRSYKTTMLYHWNTSYGLNDRLASWGAPWKTIKRSKISNPSGTFLLVETVKSNNPSCQPDSGNFISYLYADPMPASGLCNGNYYYLGHGNRCSVIYGDLHTRSADAGYMLENKWDGSNQDTAWWP